MLEPGRSNAGSRKPSSERQQGLTAGAVFHSSCAANIRKKKLCLRLKSENGEQAVISRYRSCLQTLSSPPVAHVSLNYHVMLACSNCFNPDKGSKCCEMASTASSRFFSSRPHTVVVCFGILNIFLFVFTTALAHFQTDYSSEKPFGAVGEQIKHIFHCHVQRNDPNLPGRKTTPGEGSSSPPICITTFHPGDGIP